MPFREGRHGTLGSSFFCRLSFLHSPFKYMIVFNKSTLEGRRVSGKKQSQRLVSKQFTHFSCRFLFCVSRIFLPCSYTIYCIVFQGPVNQKTFLYMDRSITPLVNLPLDPALMPIKTKAIFQDQVSSLQIL